MAKNINEKIDDTNHFLENVYWCVLCIGALVLIIYGIVQYVRVWHDMPLEEYIEHMEDR